MEGPPPRERGREPSPGMLLVAAEAEDADSVFGRTVILIVDREPNGITSGLAINRRLDQRVVDSSALALLWIPEPDAPAYWGGPMGQDPAVLAEFSAVDGLEWFHLPIRQPRPFPLPNLGVIAVAEHPEPFEGRIRRARLYVGLCVWGRGQLESELQRNQWRLARATTDQVFTAEPECLWRDLQAAG